MDNPQKLGKSYDHVIVGFNLASITFAKALLDAEKSFCLIDSKHFGKAPFKELPGDLAVYSRVPFNEVSAEAEASKLAEAEVLDGPPLTFEKGEFRSFLGFGNTKIPEIDVVNHYCNVKHLHPTEGPEAFWKACRDKLLPHVFLDQRVTQIHVTGDEVTGLTLNGNTSLNGRFFYFFDHFHWLADEIGPFAKKAASRLAKAQWFSSVSLIIAHPQKPDAAEASQLYLFQGSKEQPCLGQFDLIENQWVSRWESFFPVELTADNEATGAMIKEIKKQIKRAFGQEVLDGCSEHILVQNMVFSDFSGLGADSLNLSVLSNLHLVTPLLQGRVGWLHENLAGQLIAAQSLAGHRSNSPKEAAIEVAAPSNPC